MGANVNVVVDNDDDDDDDDQYDYDDNIIIMTIEVKNRFLIKNVFTQDTDVSKAVNSVYYLLELQRR
jgi:hypothetical protein